MAQRLALVKLAYSGDTVVLAYGVSRPGHPAEERQFGLQHVTTPRLGSQKKESDDEVYAYEARNFLRQLAVGKQVKVDVKREVGDREYGHLTLVHNGEDVATELVRKGWAKVSDQAYSFYDSLLDSGRAPRSPEQQERFTYISKLVELELQARDEAIGIFGARTKALTRHQTFEDDPVKFLNKYKGKALDGIVEQARDGSTLRVALHLPNWKKPTSVQYILVALTAIKTPQFRKGIPDMPDVDEPFGEEAKLFVESRLLQRQVIVHLEGPATSPNGPFSATVLHPAAGNIAKYLLEAGLAKYVEWSASMLTDQNMKQELCNAEAHAKNNHLKLWSAAAAAAAGSASSSSSEPAGASRGVAGSSASSGDGKDYEATVIRIVSGDQLQIRQSRTGAERRVQLASIRQPKANVKEEEAYSQQAKEYLRKKLIGKIVRLHADYTKPAVANFDAIDCVTVYVPGTKGTSATDISNDIAVQLVERGLAGVIRHRRDDDSRALNYPALVEAEQAAKDKNKGMHSTKPAAPVELVDASANAARAKSHLFAFQRQGKLGGVVEHVINGSRFRISIPKEKISILFALSGVRAPRVATASTAASEPLGAESLEFTVNRCLQRDVEVEFDGVDKAGAFLGTLWIKGENHALSLLSEGLAHLNEYSAEQNPHTNQLFAAVRSAQSARKGVHVDYTGDDDDDDNNSNESSSAQKAVSPEQDAAAATPAQKQYLDIVISEIVDASHFYIQNASQSSVETLESLMEKLRINPPSSAPSTGFTPKVGLLCCAPFSADRQIYRARITKLYNSPSEGRLADVLFVDFGNSESVPISELTPLPAEMSSIPGQAIEARLAFVKTPKRDSEYGEDAYQKFREMVEGRRLVGCVEWTSSSSSSSANTRSANTSGGPWGGAAAASSAPKNNSSSAKVINLTLFDPQLSTSLDTSLNAELVSAGYAVLDKSRCTPAVLAAASHIVSSVETRQQRAKQTHIGVWEFGDHTLDDE
ncbi:hypothetical protein GQ42DRAFT_161125 [Ramicandelaber brevisporus]|nr:hypothetical protein GQ42DRAFT_161125 [Ramicandelaber brevisporus]